MKDDSIYDYDIQWDKEPVHVKAEEYFKYFDVGDLSDGVAINTDFASLYIMSHRELRDTIENNMADENGEPVLFDRSMYNIGTFSGYIIPEDMPELSVKKGDCAILDISAKCFSGEGLYVLNSNGELSICFVSACDETARLAIEAKVCEIRRRLVETDFGLEK